MLFTASRSPLVRAMQLRRFASVSAQVNPSSVKLGDAQVTVLPSQVAVASIDDNSSTSYLTIAFRGGSRYETFANEGITHALRVAGPLTNELTTEYGLMRNIQSTGGALDVFCDREVFEYRLQVRRDELERAMKFVRSIATQQNFRAWEVESPLQSSRITEEVIHVPAAGRAIDLLHKAAYNRGLGNSIFCPERNIGRFSSGDMQRYVNSTFSADRCVVVGYGVNHDMLIDYAHSFGIDASTADPAKPAKYYGGQVLDDRNGPATVALAVEGSPITNTREAFAFAALRLIASTDSFVEHSDGLTPLQKLLTNTLKSGHEFDMLNVSYSDSGLFGFVLTAQANEIGKGIEAVVKGLKTGSVAQADVDRAKSQLRISYLKNKETANGHFENLHAQVLRGGENVDILSAISQISVADVNAAAKKVATGKWSLGGVGDLSAVAHVSEY